MEFAHHFRVDPDTFSLKAHDPGATFGLTREAAEAMRAEDLLRLRGLQERFWAQDRYALLVVLQAMDAAGKDGIVKHVLSGVNPQGIDVRVFKAPTQEELDHDYLWRCHKALPERGRIGIFNRSHYEEVLVVRVHPEILAAQHLPPGTAEDPEIWKHRYEDINAWERYLHRNGLRIVKFFLHLSKEEQRKQFLERIEDPEKNWKFAKGDMVKRGRWDAYQAAYEEAMAATSTRYAPWFVIPADKKWFTRAAVSRILVQTLEAIDPRYPAVSEAQARELAEARRLLNAEK
jgi:PPK2 family polyphosphate:nucleotide phosphotransferase